MAYASSTQTVDLGGITAEIPGELIWSDDYGSYEGVVDGCILVIREADVVTGSKAALCTSIDEWNDYCFEALSSTSRRHIGSETFNNDTVTVFANYSYNENKYDYDYASWLVRDSDGGAWLLISGADDGGDFEAALAVFRSIGRSIELSGSTSESGVDSVARAVRSLKSGGSSSTTGAKGSAPSASSSSGWIDDYFQSFTPVTETGRGDDVVDVPCAGTPCIMKISHTGSSNFVVWGLDSSGDEVELYVNEIGSYEGTVTSLFEYDELESLEISADGRWSIEFAPMSDAPLATSGSTFEGDGVVWIDEPSMRKVRFTHDGDSNFAVWATGVENGRDLLVNEIGSYGGTVSWNDPQAIFVVTADGEWSLSW